MTGVRWEETGDDTARVLSTGGSDLATYSWSAAKNHPYFTDVRPVGHDGVLTNHAPWDHRWHHGLWFSWKFIDDVLYWEDHPGYGGATEAGLGRAHVVAHTAAEESGAVVVDERLEWRPDATGVVALHEERRMRLHTDLSLPDAWAVDWEHTWTAPEAVTLSVTTYPEHWWGGYGGLNFRAARAMAADETILASGDRSGRDAVHAEPVRWMAYGGRVDGAGTDEPDVPARGGVVILTHPDDPPVPAYTFSAAAEFGFLAAAPLMHGPRHVAAGGDVPPPLPHGRPRVAAPRGRRRGPAQPVRVVPQHTGRHRQ